MYVVAVIVLTVVVFKIENATSLEKCNFLKEIEMMKTVSKLDNELSNFVVNMLGCIVTREPMILVLEFMECGNLLDYLRVTRAKVRMILPVTFGDDRV